MASRKTARPIVTAARRKSTNHKLLLLATIYLGTVILTFNAWIVMR